MNSKNWKRTFSLTVAFVAIVALISGAPSARSDDERDAKVKEAAAQSAKAAKAFDAIAVFPEVIKAALIVGGEGGRGVVAQQLAGALVINSLVQIVFGPNDNALQVDPGK